MSLGITDTQNYADIADAIRAKNGSADTYTPSEMATAIGDLPTPTPVTKGLVFSDYDADGFPTKAEIVGMTNIPDNYANSIFYSTTGICKNIDEVILNEGLQTIGLSSFAYGSTLKRVTFPASFVTFTSNGAFGNSPFLSVIFKKDVQRIRTNTFGNASGCELYDFSNATFVPILDSAMSLKHKNGCVIKVPQSLLAEWQTTAVWQDLTNVVWQGV